MHRISVTCFAASPGVAASTRPDVESVRPRLPAFVGSE